MQLRPQPFPLPYEMFSRLPTAQPHIPVSLPDAHVLSGRTYSTISHLNVLRLGRELNIQLITLLKKYILTLWMVWIEFLTEKEKPPVWAGHKEQTNRRKLSMRHFGHEIWMLAQVVAIWVFTGAYCAFSSGYTCYTYPWDQALFPASHYIPKSQCPAFPGHSLLKTKPMHIVQRSAIILDSLDLLTFWNLW